MVDYVDAALFNDDSLDKQIHIAIHGTQSVLGNEDIVSESFQLIESLCSEENLKFGAVEPRCVKFTVKYSAPTMLNEWLTITMSLHGSNTPFQFGDYQVLSDKPSTDRTTRDITAYSHFHKILKNTYKNWYKGAWGSSDSMTIKEFRDSFFARLHQTHSWVVQETTTLPNDSVVIKKSKKIPRISGKDILNAICEINGVFGYIGRDNVFHYIMLQDTANPHEIANTYLISAEYEDYSTMVIDRVQILSEDGDILGDAGDSAEDAENPYTINNNFMLKGLGTDSTAVTTCETLAANLIGVLSSVTYVPMDANFKGNPCFEIGDEIIFHAHGNEIHSHILERTMTGIQSLRDNYVSQGEETYPEDSNTLSSKISKVQTNVGILDKTKSTNYVGTTDPSSGGGSVDPDLDLSDSNQGDIYIRYKGADEAEITIGSGMQEESRSGDADSGYNVTALCVDDSAMEGIYFHYTGLVVGETYTFALENQITTSKPLENWRDHCLCIVVTDYYRGNGNAGWWPGKNGLQAGVAYDIEGGFFIPLYYDTNNHAYSHSFTATGTDLYVVVSYTYLMNAGYDDNVRGNVKNCKLTGTRFGNGKANITHTNINGDWREITYASEVAQTQGATGGTEIAEITNNDGTKTKVYQKTVTANPTGTPSEVLSKMTIGETLYELGGGNVDDVKVDGASVVTNKIANINTMTGATAQEDGAKGLVPTPTAADSEKYLKGDGTWAEVQGGGGSAEMLAPTPFIYSDTEEQVGIWTDGKPLYQKTFYENNVVNGVVTTIQNADKIFIVDAYSVNLNGTIYVPFSYDTNNADYHFVLYADGQSIKTETTNVWVNTYPKILFTVQYTKTTDTAWQGGFKAYGFTPVIYSETEREIGVWTDGKPLYAKTMFRDTAMPFRSWVQLSFGTGIKIVNYDGITYYNGSVFSEIDYHRGANSNEYVCAACVNQNTVQIWQSIDSGATITCRVTAYYTKDADTAGSGKYAELGVPAVHYDTSERVIGTYFGKPLYRKGFEFSSLTFSSQSVTVTNDLSSIDEVTNCGGSFYEPRDNRNMPLPYTRKIYNEHVNIQVVVLNSDHTVGMQLVTNDNWYQTIQNVKIWLEYTKTTD